ncbi:unnamed protein product [Ectocarpus fasciculatus]
MGRICEQPSCFKQASYGIDGSRRRQFCSRHAADGPQNSAFLMWSSFP